MFILIFLEQYRTDLSLTFKKEHVFSLHIIIQILSLKMKLPLWKNITIEKLSKNLWYGKC